MHRIRKGDQVVVLTGKDRGKRGTVLRVLENDRVVVENVNVVKRHTRPNPMRGAQGGIVEKEMPIHVSNVALFNPGPKKADRGPATSKKTPLWVARASASGPGGRGKRGTS